MAIKQEFEVQFFRLKNINYVNNSRIKSAETSHTGFQMKKCHFKNVSSLVCICQAICNLFLLSFFIAALLNTTWSKLRLESLSVWGWLHLYWLWYVLGISREHHIGMPKIYTRLNKHSRPRAAQLIRQKFRSTASKIQTWPPLPDNRK